MGIKNISEKTGFTRLEIKVILFLLAVFITGFAAKTFWLSDNKAPVKYDYSKQDSIFLSIDNYVKNPSVQKSDNDKNVDYKQEVLDFRKPDFDSGNKDVLPGEKSIEINKAGKNDFEKLPGIGPKTADKIISYRNKTGRFLTLEGLLKVNGIGVIKFNKIKKYLYIEK